VLRVLLIVTVLAMATSCKMDDVEQKALSAGHRMTIAGHRGYSAMYPENTIPSFEAAIKHQADFIEFDIQMSKDGIPVIIHDHNVDRTTNGRGRVKSFTLAQLQALDAGSAFHPRVNNCRIPTLKEVLNLAARNHMKIYPEIKGYRTTKDIKVMIQQIIDAGFEDSAVVESFHYDDFKVVRSISKKIQLAYLAFSETDVDRALKAAETDKRMQLFSSHWLLYDSDIIGEAHRAQVPVIAWTVDKLADFKELRRLGVDGIITDELETMKRNLS
jgi:glycerophosphoryl diester phosphodiesterase